MGWQYDSKKNDQEVIWLTTEHLKKKEEKSFFKNWRFRDFWQGNDPLSNPNSELLLV